MVSDLETARSIMAELNRVLILVLMEYGLGQPKP